MYQHKNVDGASWDSCLTIRYIIGQIRNLHFFYNYTNKTNALNANAYGNVRKTSLYKLRMSINPYKVNHLLETEGSSYNIQLIQKYVLKNTAEFLYKIQLFLYLTHFSLL